MSLKISQRCLESVFLKDSERNEISEGIENCLYIASHPVGLPRLTSENTNNLHSIPWPHSVYIIVITHYVQRSRGLAFGHEFRQLLKLDVLFIGEVAVLVDDLESLPLLAIGARFGLLDLGVLQLDGDFCLALKALEHGSLHFGEDLAASDDNSSETDEPVYVFLSKPPHVVDLEQFDY